MLIGVWRSRTRDSRRGAKITEVFGFVKGVLIGMAGGSGGSLPGNYATTHVPDWVLRTELAITLLRVRGSPVLQRGRAGADEPHLAVMSSSPYFLACRPAFPVD